MARVKASKSSAITALAFLQRVNAMALNGQLKAYGERGASHYVSASEPIKLADGSIKASMLKTVKSDDLTAELTALTAAGSINTFWRRRQDGGRFPVYGIRRANVAQQDSKGSIFD